MGPIETAAREAGVSVLCFGSARLIRCEDAIAFLDEATRLRIRLLGAEGFRLENTDLVPDSDAILDLSDLDDPARSVEETRSFLDAVCKPGLLIEFVAESDKSGSAP